MKPTNLVAEILLSIFSIVSFVLYAKAIIDGNDILIYLSVSIYIIPKLIQVAIDFSTKYMPVRLAIINVASIAVGIIVCSISITLMALNLTPPVVVQWILILASAVMIIPQISGLWLELSKFYNIHKSTEMKIDSKKMEA